MRHLGRGVLLVVVLSSGVSNAGAVGSAGLTNQIVGAKALSMGNAFAATADDLSAVYFNPAGLTHVQRPSVSLGVVPVTLKTDYQADGGGSQKSEPVLVAVPNFYAAMPLKNERFKLAIGINSPFGLQTHWSETGPLRYLATFSKLAPININPTLAIKVNDRLSFGAGFVYSRTEAVLKSRINQSALNSALNSSPTTSPDGDKELTLTGDGWGYDLGLLFHPMDNHRIGLTYRSDIRTHVSGKTKLKGLDGTAATVFGGSDYTVDTESDLRYPASFIAGYAFTHSRWTHEIDGEWTNYSTTDNLAFDFHDSDPARSAVLNSGNPVDKDWHNTWSLGLGSSYDVNERWQLRGGYFYYPRVIPDSTWDPTNPESSRNGFMGGAGFRKERFALDFAYALVLFTDRKINNNVGAASGTSADGEYKTTVHAFALSATWGF